MSENIKRPADSDLLLITDLAERWGVTLMRAREIVKRMEVPMIRVTKDTRRIPWDMVRFRRESIEQWERSQERVYSERSAPAPVIRKGQSKLGDLSRFDHRDRARREAAADR